MQLGQTNIRSTGSVATRCLQPFGARTHRAASWLRAICAVIWLGITVSVDAQGVGLPDLLNNNDLPAGDGAVHGYDADGRLGENTLPQ